MFLSEEEILSKLKGIKRTTGQHPGGLLISHQRKKIIDYSPLNYPADDKKSEWMTTHFEYNSFGSKDFLKMDLLGHNEPTVLYELQKLTNFNVKNINFNDENVMKIFTWADVLGIPEFGTIFNEKNFLFPLKPTKFSQLIQISGLSHGTNVWLGNQKNLCIYEKKLNLDELISCREDVWKLFISYGIDESESFLSSEMIRKGKDWNTIPIKDKIEEIFSKEEKGKIYLSILKKIIYLFPKPHAIAYTMNAWRTAYYKVYYPNDFYSVLLTYHTSVHDIWLMSLNKENMIFRIKKIIEEIDKYKTRRNELISIIKVINLFVKEIKRKRKDFYNVILNFGDLINNNMNDKDKNELSSRFNLLKKIEDEVEKVLKIENLGLNEIEKKEFDSACFFSKKKWKITSKEDDLLFSLKIMAEIDSRSLNLKKGFNFNKSNKKEFKVEGDTMFFPISSISGMGEVVSEKIVKYREDNNGKIKNWKEELKGIINTNQMNVLLNLEKSNLMI